MTIRRWMITVLFVAAIVTAGQFGWRWWNFRRLAASHRLQARMYAASIKVPPAPSIQSFVEATVEESLREIEESNLLWGYDATEHRGTGAGRGYSRQTAFFTIKGVRRVEELLTQTRENLKQAQSLIERRASRIRRLALYHSEMSRKYQRAASRPWLLVPPDPPAE